MTINKPIFGLDGTMPGIKGNGKPNGEGLGKYLLGGPDGDPGFNSKNNQTVELNFTGTPGTASALYYSLVFKLPKWGYNVVKANEWIEVSPTHKEYYDRTVSTKRMLEGVIKEGLASASSAVADYELLKHDLRKYEDILGYFDQKDVHSLKAMFIDQVDAHTGEGIAMRSIAPRWPTIISDFMKLDDKDVDVDKIAKKLNVAKAEAVILTTKNKLFQGWKKTILSTVSERYGMLHGLVTSRQKSVAEYRDWLKPYIARFQMTKLGGETPFGRAATLKTYADITGQSTFANGIRVFAWKVLKAPEARKPFKQIETVDPIGKGFTINPYDSYVREKFILNTKKGLAAIYPWLTDALAYCKPCNKFYNSSKHVCKKCGKKTVQMTEADRVVIKDILPEWRAGKNNLDPTENYYTFFDFDISRVGSRLPIGELEDVTFNIKAYTMTQNILLVKLLEIKCRELEIEKYIDDILGLKIDGFGPEDIARERYPEAFGPKSEKKTDVQKFRESWGNVGSGFSEFFGKAKVPKSDTFMFSKPGPYESHFKDRITKLYLKPVGGLFAEIRGFLINQMGVR